MEFWMVDRIEEDWVICQNDTGEQQEFPIKIFPNGIKEGDCFSLSEGKIPTISIEETQRRRKIALDLRKRLFSR